MAVHQIAFGIVLLRVKCVVAYAIVIGVVGLAAASSAGVPAEIEHYRLVKGFLAESKNDAGFADGTGFSQINPWGQYTAYLLSVNAKGQRTFRIEHYLPITGRNFAQGSTMYLLEGSRQALLIDTGNPAKAVEGVNDLKTVVRYLLGHKENGDPKNASSLARKNCTVTPEHPSVTHIFPGRLNL